MELLTINCRGNKIQIDEETIKNLPTIEAYWNMAKDGMMEETKATEFYINCSVETMHQLLDIINTELYEPNENVKHLADFLCVTLPTIEIKENKSDLIRKKIIEKHKKINFIENKFKKMIEEETNSIICCINKLSNNTEKKHKRIYDDLKLILGNLLYYKKNNWGEESRTHILKEIDRVCNILQWDDESSEELCEVFYELMN